MRPQFSFLCSILFVASTAFAQDLPARASSSSSSSSGGILELNENKPLADQKFIRTETGAVIDVEGFAKSEAERKAALEAHGYEYRPPQPGTTKPLDYFVMPDNEVLSDCIYTQGFSFPSVCVDEKGRKIFESSKHDQKVLDKIVAKQGKKGSFNKMPGGGPMKYEGVEEKKD